MNFLIRHILSQPWAIDQQYVEANLSWIIALAQGDVHVEIPKEITFSSTSLVGAGGNRINGELNNAQPGSIAVIRLSGPLMKNDQFCGPVGTSTVGSWIKQADKNPNIDGIILVGDSPGGTVDGTEELASIVKGTKKPIVGLVDGLCASAAYWVLSQCDEIIANGQTSTIGSIGTMMSWASVRPLLEKAGVKFHEVYSSMSPDKNRMFTEADGGNYSLLVETLDSITKVFHSNVKAGRASIDESALTGHTYLSNQAKKIGLIDSIGNMDAAIKSIQKRKKQSQNMSTNATLEKYPHLCALLGFKEGFESNDKGTFLNDANLATLETSLANAQLAATASVEDKNKIATLTGDLNTANQNLTAVTTDRDTWKTKAEELGKQRSNNGSDPVLGAVDNPPQNTPGSGPKETYVDDGSQAILDSTRRP